MLAGKDLFVEVLKAWPEEFNFETDQKNAKNESKKETFLVKIPVHECLPSNKQTFSETIRLKMDGFFYDPCFHLQNRNCVPKRERDCSCKKRIFSIIRIISTQYCVYQFILKRKIKLNCVTCVSTSMLPREAACCRPEMEDDWIFIKRKKSILVTS